MAAREDDVAHLLDTLGAALLRHAERWGATDAHECVGTAAIELLKAAQAGNLNDAEHVRNLAFKIVRQAAVRQSRRSRSAKMNESKLVDLEERRLSQDTPEEDLNRVEMEEILRPVMSVMREVLADTATKGNAPLPEEVLGIFTCDVSKTEMADRLGVPRTTLDYQVGLIVRLAIKRLRRFREVLVAWLIQRVWAGRSSWWPVIGAASVLTVLFWPPDERCNMTMNADGSVEYAGTCCIGCMGNDDYVEQPAVVHNIPIVVRGRARFVPTRTSMTLLDGFMYVQRTGDDETPFEVCDRDRKCGMLEAGWEVGNQPLGWSDAMIDWLPRGQWEELQRQGRAERRELAESVAPMSLTERAAWCARHHIPPLFSNRAFPWCTRPHDRSPKVFTDYVR